MTIAIKAENLSKQFRIGKREETPDSLTSAFWSFLRSPIDNYRKYRSLYKFDDTYASQDDIIWALRDISFQIKPGERVGIIGPNGAGKSTLLKILSKITPPTKGQVMIRGRVSSLLEVGTGFHPELTGRENVYLNGTVLGMRKTEVDQVFDKIVAFSGVELFLDTPVKRYSSGMRMRLAFAVAAHLEPEILIVDEVLAVGDVEFQQKCLAKMEAISNSGKTVLFVSHSMGSIAQLCDRVIWLGQGKIHEDGPAQQIIAGYVESGMNFQSTWSRPNHANENNEIRIVSAKLKGSHPEQPTITEFDKPTELEIVYEIDKGVPDFYIFYRVADGQGNILWTSWDTDNPLWRKRLRQPGLYRSTCIIPPRLLRPGQYKLSVGYRASSIYGREYFENVLGLIVSEVGFPMNADRVGLITPKLEWEVQPLNNNEFDDPTYITLSK